MVSGAAAEHQSLGQEGPFLLGHKGLSSSHPRGGCHSLSSVLGTTGICSQKGDPKSSQRHIKKVYSNNVWYTVLFILQKPRAGLPCPQKE